MASSIPAAWTALLAVGATALPGVEQVDGEISGYVAAEQFTLLTVVGNDTPQVLAGGIPQMFNEVYEINGYLRTYAGGRDITSRRVRVLEMKDALRDTLAADMSMGLPGSFTAWLSSYNVSAGFTEDNKGVAGLCEFAVHVQNLQP